MDFIVETKKKIFIGIDNGKSGAIVVVDENENIVFKEIMPLINNEYDLKGIENILNRVKMHNCKVYLEKAFTKPMNGNKANFTNGYQYGLMQGILFSNRFSYEVITVQGWQNSILKGITAKNTKEASISFCLKKWSELNWKKSDRCKKYHDGLTDAACIALYCKRKYL